MCLAGLVALGAQEITIKGEKTRLSAVKALERISCYVFFFFVEADLCLSSVFPPLVCLITCCKLIEEVQVIKKVKRKHLLSTVHALLQE